MKVLKISTPGCAPCLVMKPRWAEIEAELDWLNTEFIDATVDPSVIEKYNIEHSPTFLWLDTEGKVLDRRIDEIEKDELIELCEKYRNK